MLFFSVVAQVYGEASTSGGANLLFGKGFFVVYLVPKNCMKVRDFFAEKEERSTS